VTPVKSLTFYRRSVIDMFRLSVVAAPEVRGPILTVGSTSFFHHRTDTLYYVAVTKMNVNTALVFEFLNAFIQLGKRYFGKVTEDTVKENFSLFYELVDGK
jgi:AP-2 complex subunit mu-1